MHQKAHILVTHFCNPETLSNAHGLLGCYLQCNPSKNLKKQQLKRELSRFLFNTDKAGILPTKTGKVSAFSSFQTRQKSDSQSDGFPSSSPMSANSQTALLFAEFADCRKYQRYSHLSKRMMRKKQTRLSKRKLSPNKN